jgi:hypothetical protein
VLSAPTAETTAGDPARAALRRDFKMAAAGLGLVCAGALILGTAQHSSINPDTLHKAAAATALTRPS